MTADKAMHPNHLPDSNRRERRGERAQFPAYTGQTIAGHPAVSNYVWSMVTMQDMEETAVRVRYGGEHRGENTPRDGYNPFYRGIRAEMRSRFGAPADQIRVEANRDRVVATVPIKYASKHKPRLGMDIPLCIPFEDFLGLWLRTVEIDFSSYSLTIGTLHKGKKGFHIASRDLDGDPVEPIKEDAALRLAKYMGIVPAKGEPKKLFKGF